MVKTLREILLEELKGKISEHIIPGVIDELEASLQDYVDEQRRDAHDEGYDAGERSAYEWPRGEGS